MWFSVFGLVHKILCNFFYLNIKNMNLHLARESGRINSAPGILLDEKSDMPDRIQLGFGIDL